MPVASRTGATCKVGREMYFSAFCIFLSGLQVENESCRLVREANLFFERIFQRKRIEAKVILLNEFVKLAALGT